MEPPLKEINFRCNRPIPTTSGRAAWTSPRHSDFAGGGVVSCKCHANRDEWRQM